MTGQDKYKYRVEIQQMMFVSGETIDPPVETTWLIEDIVRGQVIDIIIQSTKTANARGSKSIAPEDVIFLIRSDKPKVNRLRTYLSWKDVRKNAKDQEAGGVEGADLIDDSTMAQTGPGGSGGKGGAGPADLMKMKKSKIRLPWELQFMFSEQPLEDENEELDDAEREASLATLKRLKMADDRTRNMTREEYVHWSECRQASFTFRKGRRFREWAGFSSLTDGKPSDDVVDILGFLTFEIVCSLTEEALIVKQEEVNLQKHQATKQPSGLQNRRKRLFDGPDEAAKPLSPAHIIEAWRRLQNVKKKHKALRNFGGGKLLYAANLI
jgi:transcription initiation protein SPT3